MDYNLLVWTFGVISGSSKVIACRRVRVKCWRPTHTSAVRHVSKLAVPVILRALTHTGSDQARLDALRRVTSHHCSISSVAGKVEFFFLLPLRE